jgi:hypothetical protein
MHPSRLIPEFDLKPVSRPQLTRHLANFALAGLVATAAPPTAVEEPQPR